MAISGYTGQVGVASEGGVQVQTAGDGGSVPHYCEREQHRVEPA